jgi:hypothetical protein
VPVAVAVPKDDHSADLLSGLVAGSLPGADQLLVQADQARAKLEAKFGDAAAAVLGAHFLSRFSPDRAPVPWLENLGRLLPAVADGPTLLAWRLIADGSADGRKVSRSDIQQILSDAARRPCTLFARTRALLTQALRLYGPEQPEPSSSDSPRPFLPGDFLNVAADAGGVEAFWGASPDWPGRSSHPLDQRPQEPVVRFDRGSFR